jgi:hypothetical protein
MGRYDTLLEEPKKPTPPEETKPLVKEDIKQTSQPVKKRESNRAINNDSKQASTNASTLANNQDEVIELIRKTVKRRGKEVIFVRLTPEEKAQLRDINYTYERQGIETSANEIGRIGLNYLIADYQANGEESVLAKVIAALNA